MLQMGSEGAFEAPFALWRKSAQEPSRDIMPFAILGAALLAIPVVALTEPLPVPQGGQIDHFSYSVYLDDAKEKRGFRLPRLRLPKRPRVRLPHVKVNVGVDQAKTALKAVPLLAAAVAEIPAVREELQQHLGKDLAPHVVAGEVARKLKTEAQRLGSQAATTAELAAAAAQDGVRHMRGLVEGVAEEVNETVVLAERAAEELLHHPQPVKKSTHRWVYWAFALGVLLGCYGYRRSERRLRRPTGTRGARGTSTPPRSGSNSVLPLAPREAVMQRAPSFSSLTPVRVNKVEFQRVEVTAPEWDSPSEFEKEPTVDEARPEGGLDMGKPRTEYYRLSPREEPPSLTSPRDPRHRASGA
eukprot:symbB.v1.2.021142.t1/scaffold1812.1/size105704/6